MAYGLKIADCAYFVFIYTYLFIYLPIHVARMHCKYRNQNACYNILIIINKEAFIPFKKHR